MLAQFSRLSTTPDQADNPSYQLRAALARRLAAHRLAARENLTPAPPVAAGILPGSAATSGPTAVEPRAR